MEINDGEDQKDLKNIENLDKIIGNLELFILLNQELLVND